MKQLIIENAQWIFSGVGVVIIVGLVRFALGLRTKGRKDTSGHVSSQHIYAGHGSTNVQTGDASTVSINHPIMAAQSHDNRPIKVAGDGAVSLKARIFEGGFREFIWGSKTVRISVPRIVRENFYLSQLRSGQEASGAEVQLSMGGGLVYSGADCRETGVNQYLMPQKEFQDEEPYSVYAYHTGEKYFHFMRIYVDHVNQHSRQVTLDLVFVNVDDLKRS